MEIICPKCGMRYRVSDTVIGKSVRCKAAGCGQVFTATVVRQQSAGATPQASSDTLTPSAPPAEPSRAQQGAPKRKRPLWKVLIAVVVVVLLLGVLLGRKKNTTNEPRSENATKERPEVPKEWEDVVRAYSDNAVAADAMYNGRTVRFAGQIKSIDTPLGKRVVRLYNLWGNHQDTICYLGSNPIDEIAKLHRGQEVYINGTCRGRTLGSVIFDDCVIDFATFNQEIQTEKRRQQQEREKQHELGKQLVKDLFGTIPGRPVFLFSLELGVGNAEVECVGKSADLTKALQKARHDSELKDLATLLDSSAGNEGAGSDLTPSIVEGLYNSLCWPPGRFQVMIRTSADLSKATRYCLIEDQIEHSEGWERHPDGGAWLFPWNPRTREGIIVPDTSDNSEAFSQSLIWISNEVEKARRSAEIENKPFSEKLVAKTIAAEAWKKLKTKCLGAAGK
jgi:predicted Zn finger-like uncharacterized protein